MTSTGQNADQYWFDFTPLQSGLGWKAKWLIHSELVVSCFEILSTVLFVVRWVLPEWLSTSLESIRKRLLICVRMTISSGAKRLLVCTWSDYWSEIKQLLQQFYLSITSLHFLPRKVDWKAVLSLAIAMHLESSRAPASKSEYLLEVVYAQAAFWSGSPGWRIGAKGKKCLAL